MALVDSRMGPGTLSLGTLTGAEAQISEVKLVPNSEETDGTPTLEDPTPAPEVTTSWTLEGAAIQDWEEPTGFVEFCRTNDGATVAFTWTPSTSVGISYAGNCVVKAVEIGGAPGEQLTTSWSFPVVGTLSRTGDA